MAASNPLKRFTDSIKGSDKASKSASETLYQIIEQYSADDAFAEYFEEHWQDAGQYLRKPTTIREGLFRASSAGTCLQQQAFNAVASRIEKVPTTAGVTVPFFPSVPVRRKTTTWRALWNGTYAHVRWHMFFDYLQSKGIVTTLFAEELRYYQLWELSGTPDRVIEFLWNGNTLRAIIDFKTMKHEYFAKLVEPSDTHAAQQHDYGLLGFDADKWMMLYEDKNNHDLKIYDRDYDYAVYEKLNAGYKAAQRWVSDVLLGLPLTATLPIDTTWCGSCEWNSVCKIFHPERDKAIL